MRNIEHVRPLTRIELRRELPMMLRLAGAAVLLLGIFALAGKRSPPDQLAIALGIGIGTSLIVPFGIWRDKLEGTLDFLCGLPVEASSIAASRFIVMAIGATPWSIAVAVAAARLPSEISLSPIPVAILTWLLLFLIGSCLTALIAKFGLEALAGWPAVGVLLFVSFGPGVVRRFIPAFTSKQLLELAQRPYVSIAAAALLMILIALLGTFAFEVTTRAIASYRHDTSQT